MSWRICRWYQHLTRTRSHHFSDHIFLNTESSTASPSPQIESCFALMHGCGKLDVSVTPAVSSFVISSGIGIEAPAQRAWMSFHHFYCLVCKKTNREYTQWIVEQTKKQNFSFEHLKTNAISNSLLDLEVTTGDEEVSKDCPDKRKKAFEKPTCLVKTSILEKVLRPPQYRSRKVSGASKNWSLWNYHYYTIVDPTKDLWPT